VSPLLAAIFFFFKDKTTFFFPFYLPNFLLLFWSCVDHSPYLFSWKFPPGVLPKNPLFVLSKEFPGKFIFPSPKLFGGLFFFCPYKIFPSSFSSQNSSFLLAVFFFPHSSGYRFRSPLDVSFFACPRLSWYCCPVFSSAFLIFGFARLGRLKSLQVPLESLTCPTLGACRTSLSLPFPLGSCFSVPLFFFLFVFVRLDLSFFFPPTVHFFSLFPNIFFENFPLSLFSISWLGLSGSLGKTPLVSPPFGDKRCQTFFFSLQSG